MLKQPDLKETNYIFLRKKSSISGPTLQRYNLLQLELAGYVTLGYQWEN